MWVSKAMNGHVQLNDVGIERSKVATSILVADVEFRPSNIAHCIPYHEHNEVFCYKNPTTSNIIGDV
ncbi:hypothetical protein BBBOND_0211380 [Babesia bigemina]|uniref:Uncharacterized protein n=1 Tax=Babesia bigemina TaxID=5866 RepID=A0A061D5J0_BABBI|nr:hypothetical protein BBBOND_0211380 [Babesia bigemina]CDR95991.1 hypothetical protein BBBOND_0211380 [Babesia bigemina]|eukprot:XP_012768177.1 hypothetical protein BBBOND_0211380 [Babesia bigemina]